ncbi:PfkB family carbohydrate kinase [Solicola gregarius]|uniref:PfkB family carbohydrate kinase n=1 Tax=Solicola gregarius TaxID=2908642 RepID=A0AA46YKF9_9ACTN|nr:PfkB family carbohydrate kinase [Solicola gregarius]UYM04421.1 PfkB family carbohydrate kinase [Solicola gregarius]
MARLVHAGQALVDAVIEVERLPETGGDVMASASALHAGGAVNVLVAAARAGGDAVHAGAHGTGPFGDLIRAAFAREHIVAASPPIADSDTGLCVVLVEPSAERTFVTTQGAERRLSVDTLRAAGVEAGDYVCVTGYTLLHETSGRALLDWLPEMPADAHLVLDPGALFGDVPSARRAAVVERTSLWTSNRDEAAELCGLDDPAAAAPAVATLLGGAAVVVRDGERGCVVHADGRTTPVPGFPVRAIDTNGAGDAHIGTIVAERCRGTDWVAAARRANAAAAIKVTRRGPATAPTRAEVDAFLAGR